jgi:uncharacterized membrane protein
MTIYLDIAKRKELVARWIPTSLVILHIWATGCWLAALNGTDNETIQVMFNSCGYGIGGLLLLLITDRATDIFLARAGALSDARSIEKTTTEKTVVTPMMPEPEISDVRSTE